MNVQLTEEIIRQRASEQSFQRGREYYEVRAIYDPSWQAMPGGIVLMAYCEGSSAPSYRLRVELDAGGVRATSCTCPYDWGGDCKHIVALLLMYLHQPEEFNEQRSLSELLAGLEKDELLALLTRLVQKDPDLYDELELAIPAVQLAAQQKTAAQSKSAETQQKRQTQVSESVYRKQVKRILKQSRYYEEDYDEWGSSPAYLNNLEEVQQTAKKFIDAGDAEGAMIILRVLLEETLADYDGEMDYDGDFASFIQSLGMPLAEAILSAELDDMARQELRVSMEELLDDVDDVIEASDLEVILAALDYDWAELPDKETQWEELEEEEWMLLDELQQARLNVLERQGRLNEFLQLAESADPYRYTLKLLELGRVDEAIAASQRLEYDRDILLVAKRLREAGRLKDAITLAERGLELEGNSAHEVGTWLAPLEEAQGKSDMALLAYRTAFDAHPSIELYRHIKRLSGSNWKNLRQALVQKVNTAHMPDTLVDIHLEEHEWDAAIALAEKETWYGILLEKVADAVIPHRPDWVIHLALKQSDALIAKTQSNLYPAAAQWLRRAKKAYQHKGQLVEWQVYITNLRATYARRPALQKAIAGL
ncbi:MAG TPA: SWIM zinc finger family protein [Anaerolineales bacterium]|nr:SWIM zinc finger family protein [Anaerolineales bacterium]